MAAVVVAFDGTRVNDSDSNSGWSKLNSTGGSPASEAQLKYQGNTAVNVKYTGTTPGSFGGIQYNPGSGAIDMTATTHPLWFFKGVVSDSADLNVTEGSRARLGSSSTLYYYYAMSGTNANRGVYTRWPDQGGYLITAINPNVSAWREGTAPGGAPSLSAVDYFSFAAVTINGLAKNENIALDAIDLGRGLLLTRGDAGSTEANFGDFVTFDQDTVANRWGCVVTKAGIIFAIGKLTIGESGTATEFIDAGTDVIIFPDGYHGAGDAGILCSVENVSTVINMNASRIRGRGSITTEDTRPDFVVVGTSGVFTMDGMTLGNFRNITFTSVCSIINADLEFALLTPTGAEIEESTLRTVSVSQAGAMVDPTFGTTTDLHDCEFVQAGAGHAIQLTGTSYSFTGLTFTGYGANGTNDAALYLSNSSDVTINVSNGDTPTYRYTGGGSVTINNNVTVTLTGLQANSEVRVYDTSDDSVVDGVENSGTSFGFSYTAGENVYIRIFHVDYEPADIVDFDIPSVATSIPVQQRFDRNFSNP